MPNNLPSLQSLNEVPAKIDVAFRVLHYCRSVSDPQSVGLPAQQRIHAEAAGGAGRLLTQLEKGAENAALNLIRNYLAGEVELGPLADLQQAVGRVPEPEAGSIGVDDDDAIDDGPRGQGEAA